MPAEAKRRRERMADDDRGFDAHDFIENAESRDGYFGSLPVAATRVAQTIAEAADDGWELLAVAPYHLKNGVTESEVEGYMLLLWKEK
jgi:hypothetical protein